MNKKLAAVTMAGSIAGGAAIGMITGVPGLAHAADTSASSTATGSSTDQTNRDTWMTDALKKLVDAGTINQSQSDAVAKALEDARPAPPDGGRGGPPFMKQGVATAASAIGISESDLQTALKSGQTIADVAKSKNVDLQKVIDAVVAQAQTDLAQQVTDGKITQAQADQIKTDLTQHVTDMVNGVRPSGGPGAPPPTASTDTAS